MRAADFLAAAFLAAGFFAAVFLAGLFLAVVFLVSAIGINCPLLLKSDYLLLRMFEV